MSKKHALILSYHVLNDEQVTEAVRSIRGKTLHDRERLQEEMSSIQLVSDKVKNEWNTYMEKVGRQFQENVSSVSNTRMKMENNLHCWYAANIVINTFCTFYTFRHDFLLDNIFL